MTSLDYISIPASATRLHSTNLQRAKKVTTPLPASSPPTIPITTSAPSTLPTSPTNAAFSVLPQMLFSSAIPASPTPSKKGTLLTNKEALSIPITTVNFKRFVAKSTSIWWMQDRVEEVVMWQRGWRVTGCWMAAYAFFCYFPKMIFAIPHLLLIGVILATYPYSAPTPPPSDLAIWQANLQAIQNLMGFVADIHDLVVPHIHLLSTSSPYVLISLLLTLPPLALVLSSAYFPTRLVCLVGGLAPLVLTHPTIRPMHPHLIHFAQLLARSVAVVGVKAYMEFPSRTRRAACFLLNKSGLGRRTPSKDPATSSKAAPPVVLETLVARLRDNDHLSDACWGSEMRETELWENQRYLAPPGSSYTSSRISRPHSMSSDFTMSMSTGEPDFSSLSVSSSPERRASVPLPLASTVVATPIPEAHSPWWSKENLRNGERRAWTRGRDGWGGVRPRSGSVSAGSRSHGTIDEGSSLGGGADAAAGLGQLDEMEGKRTRDADVEGGDGDGVVSSNLTFNLAPGWGFVRSEGWRVDYGRRWALDHGSLAHVNPEATTETGPGVEVVADPMEMGDGWVYTNDAWGGQASGVPFPGSVTRRRRWVRRIWWEGTGV
ncbi:hypothetical protein H0H92_002254 [Tricholoma furcatifolium]|nr:hypothetical protein H0H92_002254 [Tricholoma furcatifolium]